MADEQRVSPETRRDFIRKVATSGTAAAAVFERVFHNPRSYGFDNIDRPDRARSATTALYFDGFHFGYAGQKIIAGAI